MEPVTPTPAIEKKPKFLDQGGNALHSKHYNPKTEAAWINWIKNMRIYYCRDPDSHVSNIRVKFEQYRLGCDIIDKLKYTAPPLPNPLPGGGIGVSVLLSATKKGMIKRSTISTLREIEVSGVGNN